MTFQKHRGASASLFFLLKGLPSDGGRGGGLNPISRKRYGSRYTMEAPTDTQIIDRLRYADGDAVSDATRDESEAEGEQRPDD